MSEQLKPCPFCGSKDIGTSYHLPMFGEDMLYFVVCNDCGAMSYHSRVEKRAIEAWNRRVHE